MMWETVNFYKLEASSFVICKDVQKRYLYMDCESSVNLLYEEIKLWMSVNANKTFFFQ
jgi:hypothetical protein